MSAYLKFFELETSPFDTSAQSKLVLGTRALRAAYKQIEDGLAEDAPRICVSGKAGMGKTSLARALPKLLGDGARVVVLLNPALPWLTLRTAIIRQLDLEGGTLSRRTLVARRSPQRRLVLVIDQAEKIAKESLEHLDTLLNYRNDDGAQLVHAVLLANLEQASQDETSPLLWWLDSLTTLQLEFAPIPAQGIQTYIDKHLKRAGWKGEGLFTPEAIQAIHRLTGGVPRAVSDLCEKLLAEAADRGVQRIGPDMVEDVCGEERSAAPNDVSAREPQPETVGPADAADADASTAPDLVAPAPISKPRTPVADADPPSSIPHAGNDSGVPSITGLDAYFGAQTRSGLDHEAPIAEDTPSVDDLAETRFRPLRYVAIALAAIAIGGAAWLTLGGNEAGEVTPPVRLAKRPSSAPSATAQSRSAEMAEAGEAVAPIPLAQIADEQADPTKSKAPAARSASSPSAGVAVGALSDPDAIPIQVANAIKTQADASRPSSKLPATAPSKPLATAPPSPPAKASSAPASRGYDSGPPPFESDERHF